MKTYKLGIGVVTALLVVGTAGCGKVADKVGEKVTEKGLEKTIEQQSGGEVDLDLDSDGGGGMTMKGEDGSELAIGSGAKIPDDWPELLAVPKGFEVQSSTTMKLDGGKRTSVMATGRGDGEEIFESYKSRIESAGYEINQEVDSGDNGSGWMRRINATTDSSVVSVTMSEDADSELVLSLSSGSREAD